MKSYYTSDYRDYHPESLDRYYQSVNHDDFKCCNSYSYGNRCAREFSSFSLSSRNRSEF